jgi:probable addiction module antidote protein
MKKEKAKTWKTWENFGNVETMVEYLNLALESGDHDKIVYAIGNILKAKKLMAKLAKKIGVNRTSLYVSLSGKGKPNFETMLKLIANLGLGLRSFTLPTRKKAS